MGKALEFEFEGGGRLRLELLADGELLVHLQAKHPGEAWKTTATSVVVDVTKVVVIKEWLNSNGGES